MKSESAESPKQLPVGPDSAEIFDFLYVDRIRISALYAQLFPQGILTAVKTTSQQSFSDDSNIGTDIRVFKAETKSLSAGSEAIEHQFDASWSIPLEVLDRLQSLALVRPSLKSAALGSIVLLPRCYLRIIDYGTMKGLWEPTMGLLLGKEEQNFHRDIVGLLKGLPHAIHAQFLTEEGYLWSSMQTENLTIPADDLTLKYGGTVSGAWKLLFVLDAWADRGDPPDLQNWSAGDVTNGVLTAMHALRTQFGRPSGWLGITPLMIFRSINSQMPQP